MAEGPVGLVQIVVLALVQGITEFLPISSSAHLILVPVIAEWPDQGIELDIAVHVGTLGAVGIYFRDEVRRLLRALLALARGRATPDTPLLILLVVGTIPLIAAGVALTRFGVDEMLRSVEVIAWATIVFAAVLYTIDLAGRTTGAFEQLTWCGAPDIGLIQCFALVPGTSRAGACIIGGRLLGMERAAAARFSMLLSIPAILAAGGYATVKVAASGDLQFGISLLVAGALAFVAALLAIAFLMFWVRRSSYTIFVIYRLILGGGLLWWVYAN